MSLLKYTAVNIIETLLRAIPVPSKTGLVRIGNPGRNSPVLLTCNYHLAVERVKRALKGMDCYLLVANSRGINVWCAATGGHLTNHDVISVLKTSGIEKLVDHKEVILPQLAAPGVEGKVVKKKTGWTAIWGPVYARDIPAFVENNFAKTPGMGEVRFPLAQRLEMAAAWAFPLSAITALFAVIFWREALWPLTALVWALPTMVFSLFPLYRRWVNPRKEGMSFSRYTILFDFGRIPLILCGVFLLSLLTYSLLTDASPWKLLTRWGLVSLVLILLLSIDLTGSTPLFKSGLHDDRFLRIVLDQGRCKGAGLCEQVCPRNCHDVDKERRIATMPRHQRCVQCGACIVQCPFDALCFMSPGGEILSPETVRKFKLNLVGKRLVRVREKD